MIKFDPQGGTQIISYIRRLRPLFWFQNLKGALSWYGKLTWESAHAWNLIISCLLIVWGMTFIFMVHLGFYAIPLLIYDVMYDITTIP